MVQQSLARPHGKQCTGSTCHIQHDALNSRLIRLETLEGLYILELFSRIPDTLLGNIDRYDIIQFLIHMSHQLDRADNRHFPLTAAAAKNNTKLNLVHSMCPSDYSE